MKVLESSWPAGQGGQTPGVTRSALALDDLAPMAVYAEPDPALWASLDADGLHEPFLVYRLAWRIWWRRMGDSIDAGRIPAPVVHKGDRVHAIAQGNQRVLWARARGYTHVDALLCQDENTMKAVRYWMSRGVML